jgi:hypothetical protein
MTAPFAPDDAEADPIRAFALACRAERDRLSLASIAEQERRFESASAERMAADLFASRLIALASRR